MPVKTGWKSLHMAFAKAAPGAQVTISFFGGEPMLEFPLMVQMVRVARRLAWRRRNPLRFSITTNGTILAEKHLRFLYTYDFDVAVSVDGLSEGNKHRP